MASFSLVRDEPLNRWFGLLGLRGYRGSVLLGKAIVTAAMTYLPLALLAVAQDAWLRSQGVTLELTLASRWFLRDPAAYAQYLFFVPLTLFAEPSIDLLVRRAVSHLSTSGLVRSNAADRLAFDSSLRRARAALASRTATIALVVIAYGGTLVLVPSLANPTSSQWLVDEARGTASLTWLGWWFTLVANPLVIYVFGRWIWRTAVWTWFLWMVSRRRLRLIPGHPDGAGGLLFLSRVQAGFGLLIFAAGVVVAALTANKLLFEPPEGALDFFVFAFPVVAFVILGPSLFLLPLLAFSRQLWLSKERGILVYSRLANRFMADLEGKWLPADGARNAALEEAGDIANAADFDQMMDAIRETRIVPFDLSTVVQLLAAAGTPMLPLVVRFFPSIRPLFELLGVQ